MTMQVTITKDHKDGYKAKVLAVDTYNGKTAETEVAVLKEPGESVVAYCTTTRSLRIVEEPLP